jgi:hypothetical protein
MAVICVQSMSVGPLYAPGPSHDQTVWCTNNGLQMVRAALPGASRGLSRQANRLEAGDRGHGDPALADRKVAECWNQWAWLSLLTKIGAVVEAAQ